MCRWSRATSLKSGTNEAPAALNILAPLSNREFFSARTAFIQG